MKKFVKRVGKSIRSKASSSKKTLARRFAFFKPFEEITRLFVPRNGLMVIRSNKVEFIAPRYYGTLKHTVSRSIWAKANCRWTVLVHEKKRIMLVEPKIYWNHAQTNPSQQIKLFLQEAERIASKINESKSKKRQVNEITTGLIFSQVDLPEMPGWKRTKIFLEGETKAAKILRTVQKIWRGKIKFVFTYKKNL